MVYLSFLLPTRGRPERVKRLFQSIVDTTARLDQLEIVLAVDDDDPESQAISDDRLQIKTVVLPHGATMGTLNQTAFNASTGRFVMAVNDDILLRTQDWDLKVAAALAMYPDDIALIHVNDLLFQERLCTFPLQSRRASELIGFCHSGYRRYRIDDDVYDIYNMLAYLGHKRILYLPDVIFEHENHQSEGEEAENAFVMASDRIYVADKEIMSEDARTFDDRMEARKQAAITLAHLIDCERYEAGISRPWNASPHWTPAARKSLYEGLVSRIKDTFTYRRPDFVKKLTGAQTDPLHARRATVAVVSGDSRSAHAAECIARIKQHTTNYNLVILDNNRGPDFNHPHEMNKVIQTTDTDFLVLMDDDIYVEAGWLEGLFRCLDDTVGVVVPMHTDPNGEMNYSGAYLAGDGSGKHEHLMDVPPGPREIQAVCSAIMLIDMRKCGSIRMREVYGKYYFDLAYGLEVWEAGYRVVCTPEVTVTHLCGATMIRGTDVTSGLFERDEYVFIEDWIRTGRLTEVSRKWLDYPALRPLVEIPERMHRLFKAELETSDEEFTATIADLITAGESYYLFQKQLVDYAVEQLPILAHLNHHAKVLALNEVLSAFPEEVQSRFSPGHLQHLDSLYRSQLGISEARRLWAQGDKEAAISRLESDVDAGLIYLNAVQPLADMLFEAGKFERSIPYFADLINTDPSQLSFYCKIGLAYLNIDDLQAAESALHKAQRLAPDSPEIQKAVGRLYLRQQRLSEACFHLRQAMRLDPTDAEACMHYALALEARGRVAEAANCLESFLAHRPDPELERELFRLRPAMCIAA